MPCLKSRCMTSSRCTTRCAESSLTWVKLIIVRFQAKNVVFNVSEMEGKVREATNDDPWYVSRMYDATGK